MQPGLADNRLRRTRRAFATRRNVAEQADATETVQADRAAPPRPGRRPLASATESVLVTFVRHEASPEQIDDAERRLVDAIASLFQGPSLPSGG